MLGFDPFYVLQLMSPPLILGKADSGRLYTGVRKTMMVDQEVRYKQTFALMVR